MSCRRDAQNRVVSRALDRRVVLRDRAMSRLYTYNDNMPNHVLYLLLCAGSLGLVRATRVSHEMPLAAVRRARRASVCAARPCLSIFNTAHIVFDLFVVCGASDVREVGVFGPSGLVVRCRIRLVALPRLRRV